MATLLLCVLLCRVSSKEQEETGYSLPAQEKLLTNYADKQGFKIAKIFSITESASGKKQREIFDYMMAYVKKEGIKVIICEKVDRLTRNFKDAVDVDEWLEKDEERQVHLVKDSLTLHKNSRSQEKLNWGIRILFAKNYIDNLSEEVKKGQKEKISQGWLPTKPPIGYKTVGEKGHKIHIIDQTLSPIIKKMFQLYATGSYSLRKLTNTMSELGLRNDSGSCVTKSRIHQLLTDPFYIGQNCWNGQLSEGKQELFIDKELFERVQMLLKSKTTPKYSKHSFRFKGLLRCKECTGVITWEIQKGIIYGHCNHYRNCHQKTWVIQDKVEDQLIEEFDKLEIKNTRIVEWVRKAIKESHQDEIAFHSSSVNELNNQYEQSQKRIERLYDDKVDGKITEEFYQKKLKQYTDDKNNALEMLKKHSNASTKYYELGSRVYELSQRAKLIYLKAKMEDDKRALINLVFSKIWLNEGKLTVEYTHLFKLLAIAVKLTNSSKVDDVVNFNTNIFERQEKIDLTDQKAILRTTCPAWLAAWSDFRTINWIKDIEQPQSVAEQIVYLLGM